MEEGAVDIVRGDPGEGPVGGAGADWGLAARLDGGCVLNVFAGGEGQLPEHGLTDCKRAHLVEVGGDADDVIGVGEITVGAEFTLGIDEQHEGCSDADGEPTDVDEGKGGVFPKVTKGWFERVHGGKTKIFCEEGAGGGLGG